MPAGKENRNYPSLFEVQGLGYLPGHQKCKECGLLTIFLRAWTIMFPTFELHLEIRISIAIVTWREETLNPR